MQNPDLLIDAIRDTLRAMPAVVALVNGDPSFIESYQDDQKSVFDAVYSGGDLRILIVLTSSEFEDVSYARFIHTVNIHLRVETRRGTAFYTICNTVPEGGDGQKFMDTQIHPDFEQLGLPTFQRDLDDDGIEYPSLVMRFRDKTNG